MEGWTLAAVLTGLGVMVWGLIKTLIELVRHARSKKGGRAWLDDSARR